MSKRKTTPDEITPAEATAILRRRFDLETLLAEVERDARRCLGLKGPGKQVARNALEFAAAARRHVAAGHIVQAAVAALKAGSCAERLRLETLFERRWWKQSEICETWGLDRYAVTRAVARGDLHTNGRTGQACRIDPQSALDLYGPAYPDAEYDFAEDDRRAGEEIARMKADDDDW